MKKYKDMSFDEILECINIAFDFIEDRYLGKSSYVNMMINSPLWASFCNENKELISSVTIILKAMQYIAEDYNIPYCYQADEYVKRFEESVYKYLLTK